jgi:hypothetical protein
MKILLIFVFLIAANISLAYRQNSGDTSILNECLWNKQVVDLEVDCNDLFNHYLPKKSHYRPNSNLRFGSYNIFRSYEQQQKRWDLTAQLVNGEFDLIGISELQANKSSFLQMNINAAVALRENKISESDFKKAYNIPSYLKLLNELQKLDSSWGLLLSPFTQNESDTELFAFYYRGDQVKPIESKYCKNKNLNNKSLKSGFIFQEIRADSYLLGDANSAGVVKSKDGMPVNDRDFIAPKEYLACTLELNEFAQSNFPKLPFTARFKSGKFDSSFISLHLGFRGPYEINGTLCLEMCQKHTQNLFSQIMESASPEEEQSIKDKIDLGKNFSRESSRQVNRFFQIKETILAANEIKKIEKDEDLVIGGDFNLELTENSWQGPLWKHFMNLFSGGDVLIHEKTSLSAVKGYSSNYDHFILSYNIGKTDECDPLSAQRIDVLNSQFNLANQFNLRYELDKYDNKSHFNEITEILTTEFDNKLWVSSAGELLSAEQLKEFSLNSEDTAYRSLQFKVYQYCNFSGSTKEGKPRWIDIPTAMKSESFCKLYSKARYAKYIAALSDHVPISLTCSAN